MEGKELSLVISNPEQGQFLKRIDWNRSEFMSLVQSAMERYKGVTFTEDQVKAAKDERARLNALKKAISDRRIQIKNEVMAPYAQFEKEVREITDTTSEVIAEYAAGGPLLPMMRYRKPRCRNDTDHSDRCQGGNRVWHKNHRRYWLCRNRSREPICSGRLNRRRRRRQRKQRLPLKK